MSEAIRKQYCVGGVWKDSKTKKWMPVTDSSTGEVIAEVPSCTQDEVLEAIDAADKAFKEWSQVSVSKRTQMMFKWRNILVEHLDELTYLCAKELGKNLSEARGDVLKAIEPTELACATPFVSQGSASLQVTTGFDTATYRMPLGVVAGIVPFNFPAMIPWGWMVPLAIATGNTVVLKAASQTPLTAMRIMELFYEEGGFPAGVVNLVTCSPARQGRHVRRHDRGRQAHLFDCRGARKARAGAVRGEKPRACSRGLRSGEHRKRDH